MSRSVPALAFVLAIATSASAQERLALTYAAPEGCPDQAALRAEVVRLLGGAIGAGDPVRAEGTTLGEAGAYTLTLRTEMNEAAGERVLEGERCEELTDAAAVILALMIDPEAVAEAVELAPTEPEPPLVDPAPAPPRVEVRAELTRPFGPAPAARVDLPPDETGQPDGSPPEEPGGWLGAGGGVDVGTVPAPSAWLWLEGGWGIPVIDGRLRAGVVLPQSGLRTPSTSAGAQITSVSVDARACVHPIEGLRGLAGCGGLIAGVSVAEGFGLAATETGVGTFFGAVVSLEGMWRPVPWLSLGLDATLVIPFNPLEFAVRGTSGDEVFVTQEPVSGRFGLAADLHF